jgi:hypothetical protein
VVKAAEGRTKMRKKYGKNIDLPMQMSRKDIPGGVPIQSKWQAEFLCAMHHF